MHRSTWFFGIATIFITTLLTANITAVKLADFGTFPLIGETVLPAAIIIFPLSYIVGDILTEVYGFAATRRVIWMGFFANLILVIFIYLCQLLPPAVFWNGQEAYENILGFTSRLLIASFTAYLVGEFANSMILARLKVITEGRWLFIRTISSTVVGQGIDSALFITIAFLNVLDGSDLIRMIALQWSFKVLYEVIATPLTYAIVGFLKQKENIDIYDEETSFNPLQLR
ncbi:MAG: queuosine precursor transporter [SAR202 cluster bacterium]|nr:queuosine precursor transporter [SAR202 cluster bacterium]|tara:strand:- start:3385 stop:4071 length:687 start_codon:yes stop_codon:yes gene_type:complete